MDINKWKSVAVRKSDYDILKALCADKFRAPAAMISKLINDYVEHLAKREKTSIDKYKERLLNVRSKKR